MPLILRRLSQSAESAKGGTLSGDDSTPTGGSRKQTNGGGWFYVNKSGFPMSDFTWERMWDFAAKHHPTVRDLRKLAPLPNVPVPHAPTYLPQSMSMDERLETIQQYLLKLQYNHTGTQFFDIRKDRPYCGLMENARDMVRESLPIKCLEAVILALYLTNSCQTLDRFAISFRSVCNRCVHRHVVLGVHCAGKFGALGLSRRNDLMYKPLDYDLLSDLIIDFCNCYRSCGHVLKKIKVGLCAPHEARSYDTINWAVHGVDPQKSSQTEWVRELNRFSRMLKRQSPHPQLPVSEHHALVPRPPTSGSPKRKRKLVTLDGPKPAAIKEESETADGKSSQDKPILILPSLTLAD